MLKWREADLFHICVTSLTYTSIYWPSYVAYTYTRYHIMVVVAGGTFFSGLPPPAVGGTFAAEGVGTSAAVWAQRGARRGVVDLEAGELLYLPAGWWHQVSSTANTTEDRSSCSEGDGSQQCKQGSSPSVVTSLGVGDDSSSHIAVNYWFNCKGDG